MNTQEPPFANPETAYPGTAAGDRRPINTDPREQPQWPPTTMPLPGMAGQPPQVNHSWRWLGVSVIILVVIFGGLFSASLLLTRDVTTTRTFTVSASPRLVLTTSSSDIHIMTGPALQMTVVTHQHVFLGDNNEIPVHYEQSADKNTLTITTDEQNTITFGFAINQGIDFDVTVPQQTALTMQTSSGDITASGVHAPMSLTTSSGDITTDGGSGQISLTATSGDINASNLSGEMTLSTSSGDVTAINANATGSSSFQTSSGDITFQGMLANSGNYGFHASSGDITITLPGTAAFHIQATTQSGDLHSDFAGVQVLTSGSGAIANSTVGQTADGSPLAEIIAQTSSGDIRLNQD
jgi:hypothetical protein